nr:VRR-NUC domain-containing protein [Lacrimispora celerecrescens]
MYANACLRYIHVKTEIGSRTFGREAEKYGRRKTDRDGSATAGKKTWRQGCEIHLSGLDGVPDRLVLLPGGRCAFVELKAPGKKLRPLQEKRRTQLEALGFPVYCIDRTEMIGGVLDEIQST